MTDCKVNLTAREWWIKRCDFVPNRVMDSYESAKCGRGCTHEPIHVIEYSAYLKLREELAAIQSENARLRGALEDLHDDLGSSMSSDTLELPDISVEV